MAVNLNNFKHAGENTLEWLKSEYSGLRTGRATPSILDNVKVDAYGSKVGIRELATVSVEDSRTLRITPWDKTVSKSIDTAIRESNLGLSVSLDDQGLRIAFPTLTADRRAALIKVGKEKLEEARIRVRSERQKVINDLEKKEGTGKDDIERGKADLQKQVDEINKKLEELLDRKEKEINE